MLIGCLTIPGEWNILPLHFKNVVQLENNSMYDLIQLEGIYRAKMRLKQVALHTALMPNLNLSEAYQCNLMLKREDLQVVRSYKIRGAFNKMAALPPEKLKFGVACASAGNHAQGVALACQKMKIKGTIFMPAVTPSQKVNKVKRFGKSFVELFLIGDTYDDAFAEAMTYAQQHHLTFIPPFNDRKIIEGQATVGLEILEDSTVPIDYLFVAIGGGGLISGVGSFFKQMSPRTKIIGVEPTGAPAMKRSLEAGKVIELEKIDTFVDGAAVKSVGDITFRITQKVIDDMLLVEEGKVCSTILQLYNEEGIVVEPSGALTIAALDQYREQIRGKNVVCIISGSNNDITRTEEIKERSLLFEGLKHYFIIRFPQRAGALKDFLNNVLGPNDDITRFEYIKKQNGESGPAILGVQLQHKSDYLPLIERMNQHKIDYQVLKDNKTLFDLIV